MVRLNILCAFSLVPNKIGGRESMAVELARQLKERGRQLILCVEGAPTAAVERYLLEPGNVTIEVLTQQPGIRWKNVLQFYRLLRRYRPEAVLYALGGIVRLWPLMARLQGSKHVIYNDGTSRTDTSFKASPVLRLLMRSLTQVICVSEFTKECLIREGIVPATMCRVIYNSVALERDLGDGARFRAQYGIPSDRIVVLTVSWLVPEKGIDIALKAASMALGQRSDLHFVFCGDGKDRKSYKRMAEEMGIAGHVTWAGQVENIAGSGVFRAADMQIQCSQWHEAFCLGVAEGMSAGLPVIAARIGGLPELVSEGENGYLFEPKDYTLLAERIVELADNPGLRREMGRRGRLKALSNHDLRKNVAEWMKILFPQTPASPKAQPAESLETVSR